MPMKNIHITNTQDMREYENITTLSTWAEVMTTGKKMQGGIFLGYSKNLGAP